MTWFRRLSRKSLISGRKVAPHRRRRRAYHRANFTEQLEQKLLLGSMVPTDTGVPTGDLLPVSSVEMLSPVQRQNLTASDIALLESDQRFDAVKQDLDRLAELRDASALSGIPAEGADGEGTSATAGKDFEQHADLSRGPGTGRSADSQGSETESTASNSNKEPSLEPEVNSDEAGMNQVETDLGKLLAMNDVTQNGAEENTSGDDEGSGRAGKDGESATDDKDGDRDSDESDDETGPVVSKENSKHDRSEKEPSGSRPITGSFDLTFAGGAGPTAPVQPSVSFGGISRGGGGGGDDSEGQSVAFAGQASVPSGPETSSSTVSAGASDTETGSASSGEQITVRYDFRDFGGFRNEVTAEEQASAAAAFDSWEQATDNQIQFVRDQNAPDSEVVIIYKGALEAAGHESSPGEVLALGGTIETRLESGESEFQRVVLVDSSESFDTQVGNGDPAGTFDFHTVVGHELGHILGLEDSSSGTTGDIMNPTYDRERGLETYEFAVQEYGLSQIQLDAPEEAALDGLHAMFTDYPQLRADEVSDILNYASRVSPSEDAIIAIVDRGGRILGVRIEDGVDAGLQADPQLRTFAIDGAVAKARTAAFFSNGDPINGTRAPLTSRLVRFVSQSTVTFREVAANPNSNDPLMEGPGFVAPIGPGGHFPPETMFTPPVDLFAIEHTNRDSKVHPGPDGERGTADDIQFDNRFDIDTAHVPLDTNGDGFADNPDADMDGQADSLRIAAPESYGMVSGVFPDAQARGVATLPGGIPLFRDTSGDEIGDTLIGGIGVFFPGTDGTAIFEQDFQAGVQSEFDRTNAPKVLEAEFIATVAAGGSRGAAAFVSGAEAPETGPAAHPVPDLDIPFGRLDLVGVQLEVIGPTPGIRGVEQLVRFGNRLGPFTTGASGDDQPVDPGPDTTAGTGDDIFALNGESVPFGMLVEPHDGGDFDGIPGPDITAAEVEQIIDQAIDEARRVRAAVRLPVGSRTRMVFAVTDRSGEVLGLFRMRDATVFSIDVAVAKARNTAYYADAGALQPIDQVPGVPAGTAFTNRTFRFLSEPRFPDGITGSPPIDTFSIMTDIADASGLPLGGRQRNFAVTDFTGPIDVSAFDSVLGHDAFNPNTNFRDPDNVENQNGVVFFPGSTPVYGSSAQLIGGLGVSGDGVDQDDVVTFSGAQGFLPPASVRRADEVFVEGVRLPYQKFLRNPRG